MFNLPEKYVMIDGFKIPADKGEEYKRLRGSMAKEADKFFYTFCEEAEAGGHPWRRHRRLFFDR